LSSNAKDVALRPDDILAAGATSMGIQLGADVIVAFRAYREEILRWSGRINLTAFETPAEIVRQGFLDSLACAPLLPISEGRVVDVGSGAGFPAIPLALVKPGLDFTLVEPSRKKIAFLRHVVRRLDLKRTRIRSDRVETLLGETGMLAAFDVALARAVAPLENVGRLVFPLLRPSGIFLAQTGASDEVKDAVRCLTDGGFEAIGEKKVPPEFGKPERRILILRKASGGS